MRIDGQLRALERFQASVADAARSPAFTRGFLGDIHAQALSKIDELRRQGVRISIGFSPPPTKPPPPPPPPPPGLAGRRQLGEFLSRTRSLERRLIETLARYRGHAYTTNEMKAVQPDVADHLKALQAARRRPVVTPEVANTFRASTAALEKKVQEALATTRHDGAAATKRLIAKLNQTQRALVRRRSLLARGGARNRRAVSQISSTLRRVSSLRRRGLTMLRSRAALNRYFPRFEQDYRRLMRSVESLGVKNGRAMSIREIRLRFATLQKQFWAARRALRTTRSWRARRRIYADLRRISSELSTLRAILRGG